MLLALLLLLVIGGVLKARSVFVLPGHLRTLIEQEAYTHSLPPSLVAGVIFTESRFQERAVSSAGAVGLMQLMPDTFAWLRFRAGDKHDYSEADLTRPDINIRYGSYNLALLLEEYERLEEVLAAYNAGSGNVSKWLSNQKYSIDRKSVV